MHGSASQPHACSEAHTCVHCHDEGPRAGWMARRAVREGHRGARAHERRPQWMPLGEAAPEEAPWGGVGALLLPASFFLWNKTAVAARTCLSKSPSFKGAVPSASFDPGNLLRRRSGGLCASPGVPGTVQGGDGLQVVVALPGHPPACLPFCSRPCWPDGCEAGWGAGGVAGPTAQGSVGRLLSW